jgi:two-component system phosphate regulon sensor histidine kinase PhoR
LSKFSRLEIQTIAAAGFLGVLAAGCDLLLTQFTQWGIIGVALVTATVTVVTALILIRFVIRRFALSRINALYRTIYNIRQLEDITDNHSGNTDELLNQIQKEVTNWAKTRTSEIEDLRKLEVYRKEFLSNVSHELKTPIFNIQGYVTTLLEGGMEDPTINRKYLERTEKSVERMIHIIQDLESISRIESGELVLDKENFDVADMAKDIIDAQEMKAGKKSIKIKVRESARSPRVNADKERIRQVLTNLIVNSIKYGKENGSTEISFQDVEDRILIEVSDDGIGIAPEHLPRLFERFYRVDKGRSRDQGGTGLGLAIVKHILEAHGQSINVRSKEGAGSTFSFTLNKAK